MRPDVVIILINYNNHGQTIECISSLNKCSYRNFKILVVDNGSEHPSIETVRKAHQNVEIVETGTNLGFAGGNNFGIRSALSKEPKYILLLNNDTIVEHDFLDALVDTLESDESIAVGGGMICYHPRTDTIWYGGGKFVFWRVTAVHSDMEQRADKQSALVSKDVTFITGCMMLIRTDVLKTTGLLDERFFMYCEDVEFCRRLVRLGYRLRYVPESKIFHKIHHGGETPFTVYYGVRSRFYLVEICLHGLEKYVGNIYLNCVTALKLLYWRKKRPELFQAASAGLRDFRRGITTRASNISLRYPEPKGPSGV